jgi:hypothetical protein
MGIDRLQGDAGINGVDEGAAGTGRRRNWNNVLAPEMMVLFWS